MLSAAHTSRFLVPFLRWLDPQISLAALNAIQFGIRKLAHLTEYAILAALLWRALRGAWAWLRNRGVRDIAQDLSKRLSDHGHANDSAVSMLDRLRMLYALATRAGAERRLDYQLDLVPSLSEPEDSPRLSWPRGTRSGNSVRSNPFGLR